MTEGPLIVVYRAVNRINGALYIGLTTRGLAYRRKAHRAAATGGQKGRLADAMRQFGVDNFDFSIVEKCQTPKEALIRERGLIAELKPEYNIFPAGRKFALGWKHSEESRAKMRASHNGQPGPWRGKKRSPESIAKRTATRALNPVRYWLGKKRSPETMAKIRATRKKKPVRCINDGLVFEAVRWTAKHYKIDLGSLSKHLRGKVKSVGGLRFEYMP